MKKLILSLAIIAFIALSAESQISNRANLLLYTDTINIVGGDVLIRDVYAFEPVFKPIDTTYYFPYRKVYHMNGELILTKQEYFEGKYDAEITIGENTYTLEDIYNLIKTIDEANWQSGMWGIYLQKIN